MKKTHIWLASTVLAFACGSAARTVTAMQAPVNPDEIKWGAAPPSLPAGAKLAVIYGDPAKTGLVILRLQMPSGYSIPAHWHPTDENVTVVSGSLGLGMGDKLDRKNSKMLKPGGYALAPAKANHYAWTRTGAVVQISLMGPFAITYVNPADDPSAQAKATK